MQIVHRLGLVLGAQRGHLFVWVPVFLGIGIGIYFAAGTEPTAAQYASVAAVAGACLLLALWCLRWGGVAGDRAAPVAVGIALMAVGFAVAGARAHLVAGPQIGWRYYGPIEGRIVGIDRSASDALRLVLDRVVLEKLAPQDTPHRIRISLHGADTMIRPQPGQTVMTTGHLSVSNGPVEPGSFDFRRFAWFMGLGAVGYTRVPVLVLAPSQGDQPVFAARMLLSQRVQTALSGEVGAFAAAIMTGDRSGMGQDTLAALRVSNLAHLLAISGLHMGLLCGFVFGLIRLGLAAVPVIGLRIAAKKVAAVISLGVAAGYLALSGGNVATERAFVMAAVVLVAVMLDRRALTLRAVAVAAVIILLLQPEAMMGPGFQMSFAATTALVAVFGGLRHGRGPPLPKWAKPLASLALSSFVAGLATAPLGAAHFNQFAHYGLIANLLSVPLMGLLVMPAAVAATLLLPFGAEALPLWLMGQGLGWILGVAHMVAGFDGARGAVVSPPVIVLPMLALAALFVVLWQGNLRWLGLIPIMAASLIWAGAPRPVLLIAQDGALVGIMTPAGRALSRERGGGFIARNWLDHDGDFATQEQAAARWQTDMPLPFAPEGRLIHLTGKAARGPVDCRASDWLVLDAPAARDLPCRVFDRNSLRKTGAVAVYIRQGVPVIVTTRMTGHRMWDGDP